MRARNRMVRREGWNDGWKRRIGIIKCFDKYNKGVVGKTTFKIPRDRLIYI
jgi:hypothetical protein